MDNLIYQELRLQNYLKSPNITVLAAKNLFKWRKRSAMFKMNYGMMYVNTACPFCLVETDSQSHSLQCHEIDIEADYMDIFMDDIPCDIIITIQIISKIIKEIFD